MTKNQMNVGFLAVVLLAVAAASTSMRPHSTRQAIALPGISLEELAVDINKLPTQEFDDRSLVFPRGDRG